MWKWRVLPLVAVLLSFLVLYIRSNSRQSPNNRCSLLPHDQYLIRSKRIVTPDGVVAGAVQVKGGMIVSVVKGEDQLAEFAGLHLVDYGEAVVMPGLVDVHAHLDEPGRTEWEGFSTGTKAAAAGGITMLIDMPLNSFPSTVSEEALQLKLEAARDKIYVDVGFWGGLVPENAFNRSALESLLNAGALGLKEGLHILAKYKRPLLVHAEIQLDSDIDTANVAPSDAHSYSTYLRTRPPSWEEAAIRELHGVVQDTRVGGHAEGAHLHVVHLSDASISLDIIKDAKSSGASLSVETCPHYLAFSEEQIKDGDTRFKCAPPIRDEVNRQKLWQALMDEHIDMLSSDHSPTLPQLKLLDEGDFMRAWGGISSLQYVLPVTWSHGQRHGVTFSHLAKWWSEKPAKLAGQELKGAIVGGNYADIVVWDPHKHFKLDENYKSYLKHPSISAYMGTRLSGEVLATFVRGNLVYRKGEHAPAACGIPVMSKR